MKLQTVSIALASCLAVPAWAADRADLEGTQIRGTRELPKVLYIVPWKQPLPTELVGRPASSLLDEVLAPIDRDVFERQVRYDRLLKAPPPPEAGVETK
jgi:hypothetical protein